MRLKSTTSDLPTTYDVKVFLHNAFVKHMTNIKDKITASNLPLEMYLTLTCVGSPRESIHHHGWVVGRYHEDGILGYDSALDSSTGGEVEVESWGDRVQGFVRCT
jgi:hypothetical protein